MAGVPGILRKGIIQPRYILAIAVVFIGMMIFMGLYEFSTSKRDIMRVLEEEAMSLAEAISIMSDNVLECSNRIEDMVIERLLDNAQYLEHLDYEGQLSGDVLSGIAEKSNISQISVFDKNGREILASYAQEESGLPDLLSQSIITLLDETGDETAVNQVEGEGDQPAVGVRRRKGGAIVLKLDPGELLDLRKATGIGTLIQDIGENEGIEYIVLQDEAGLILASKNVTKIKKIAGDEFLENALKNNWLDTRIYTFGEEEILEVVIPFQIDPLSYGLFRIGLSMEEVRAVAARAKQRMVIITISVFIIGIISLSFLLVSQNYSLVSRAYKRMQTYTGMVLDNVADGIIVSDNKGVISIFNKAAKRIFRRADEVVGTSVNELDSGVKRLLDDVSASQSLDQSSEITVDLPGAGERLLSVHASSFAEAGSEPDSVVAIVRDVTDARIMEENIRRTEQLTAMGKLASAVAHEVRNPLNAISMIAQRLGREFVPREDEESYRELTGMIRSESTRLNGIIEEFLRFARPPKLDRQPADMDQLLDETISLIEAQATERGIEIDRAYSGLGVWTVDKEQVKQALLNLLINGIEAMPVGGRLSIKASVVDGVLRMEISDTGQGISEQDIARIFDLYFTTKETGTGLGLSIVQRIIMEHGGGIHVDSTPGSGTTFRIYIPPDGG